MTVSILFALTDYIQTNTVSIIRRCQVLSDTSEGVSRLRGDSKVRRANGGLQSGGAVTRRTSRRTQAAQNQAKPMIPRIRTIARQHRAAIGRSSGAMRQNGEIALAGSSASALREDTDATFTVRGISNLDRHGLRAERRPDLTDDRMSDTPSRGALLSDDELRGVEDTYSAIGITAGQIVEVFQSRGKHRGSLGVYPPKTVRRINTLKQLMSEGHTIEEIQGQFLVYTDSIEGLGESVAELCRRLDADIAGSATHDRSGLPRELAELRKAGEDFVRRLEEFTRRVVAPRAERTRLTGAAGSAEDLL